MIKPVKGGFVVVSEKGKKLSKVYPTRDGAEHRLHEIEYFKHKKGK
jgi:hypothetical protein